MQSWISNIVNLIVIFIFTFVIKFAIFCFVCFKFFTFTSIAVALPLPNWFLFISGGIINFYFMIAWFIFRYVLIILLWIFIHWMIVKYIIPAYMIIFIPFIPFVVPIPLRQPILDYIPPFKDLTEAGILPLMEKILFTFISPISFKDKFENSFDYILDYLKFSFNYIIHQFYPNFNIDDEIEKIKSGNIFEPDIPKTDDKEELTSDEINTLNEQSSNLYYQEIMKMINLEVKSCVAKNTLFITPDMNEMDKLAVKLNNNVLNYTCQINAIGDYIKANY